MPTEDSAKEQASKILGLSKETEFLQSFVRVDSGNDDDKQKGRSSHKRSDLHLPKKISFDVSGEDRKNPSPKHGPIKVLSGKAIYKQIKKEMKEKELRSRRIYKEEEVYTDKDRAAAVNMGSTDIKQSLSIKLKLDRSKALQLPDEADPSTLMALGRNELRAGPPNVDYHMRVGISVPGSPKKIPNAPYTGPITYIAEPGDLPLANTSSTLYFALDDQALELNPDDKTALVARSKCYLLVGEPKLALDDAETALQMDKNYIKAIYQKAEALFFLGDFELSLMFYHRGLRIRPELEGFRLGIQKAQEAIEKTIGSSKPIIDLKDIGESLVSTPTEDKSGRKTATPSTKKSTCSKKSSVESDKKLSRQLLGQLCVDKEYLEKLLKHPDLNVADRKTNNIAIHAEEAVQFLNKRQEFWRQQRPTTTVGAKRKTKFSDLGPFPKWYDHNLLI